MRMFGILLRQQHTAHSPTKTLRETHGANAAPHRKMPFHSIMHLEAELSVVWTQETSCPEFQPELTAGQLGVSGGKRPSQTSTVALIVISRLLQFITNYKPVKRLHCSVQTP